MKIDEKNLIVTEHACATKCAQKGGAAFVDRVEIYRTGMTYVYVAKITRSTLVSYYV